MTDTAAGVIHKSFTLTRTMEATPARVFTLWREPDERVLWGSPFEGTSLHYTADDFRIGGVDVGQCTMADGTSFTVETRYYDIVENQRIVFTELVGAGDVRFGLSLGTVVIAADGAQCHLTLTVQAVALDGSGLDQGVEEAWSYALDSFVKRAEAVPA